MSSCAHQYCTPQTYPSASVPSLSSHLILEFLLALTSRPLLGFVLPNGTSRRPCPAVFQAEHFPPPPHPCWPPLLLAILAR